MREGAKQPEGAESPPTREQAIEMLTGWREQPSKREAWNSMRERMDKWAPDLSKGVFIGSCLAHANLRGADLRGANLSKVRLDNASLMGAKLSGANLNWASLSAASLRGADLSKTMLGDADLRGAILIGADFSGARLCGVMGSSERNREDGVVWVGFRPAQLKDANLHGVKGMRLDGNDLRGVRFPPNTNEAWHTLRRAFTGTRFFFHLLLLTVFFGSMGLRAAMWVGVNRAQAAVVHAAERLDTAAALTAPDYSEAAAIRDAARELTKVKETFTAETRSFRVWQVLLGLDRGWSAAGLAAMLVVYNVLRGWLTYNVGAMREEEERSGYAPYWRDYKRAWYAHHYVMRWLILIAMLSFAWHAYFWLSAKVVLPA